MQEERVTPVSLSELHEEIFELSGRLYFNSEFLSQELYDLMMKSIKEEFLGKYKLYLRKSVLLHSKGKFKLKIEEREQMPKSWRFLFWKYKTRMAELMEREIEADANVLFKLREEKLRELLKANELYVDEDSEEPESE